MKMRELMTETFIALHHLITWGISTLLRKTDKSTTLKAKRLLLHAGEETPSTLTSDEAPGRC